MSKSSLGLVTIKASRQIKKSCAGCSSKTHVCIYFLKLFWCMHVIVTFVCIRARRRLPNRQNDVGLKALNAILHANNEVVVPFRASNENDISAQIHQALWNTREFRMQQDL